MITAFDFDWCSFYKLEKEIRIYLSITNITIIGVYNIKFKSKSFPDIETYFLQPFGLMSANG